jgi:hypothetical protein
VGPQLLMMSARYAHARQPKRAAACTRKLRTNLGRIIRQIERQKHDPKGKLAKLLAVAKKIHEQERKDKNKIYSVHEPHVQCIAKARLERSMSLVTAPGRPAGKTGKVTGAQACGRHGRRGAVAARGKRTPSQPWCIKKPGV